MSPMRTCSHQRHWEALHAHYLIVSKKIMHHSCAMGLYSVHLSYFKHPMIRCTILVGYWQCCSSLDQALKVSEPSFLPSFLPRKHKRLFEDTLIECLSSVFKDHYRFFTEQRVKQKVNAMVHGIHCSLAEQHPPSQATFAVEQHEILEHVWGSRHETFKVELYQNRLFHQSPLTCYP